MFSLTQVKDASITVGLTEDQAEEFWIHYDSQGWVFGNGLPVKRLTSALMRWRNNGYKFEGKSKKTQLYPVKGKRCYKKGCVMPAVYGPVGEYEAWYCGDHMPDKVKEKYTV